MQDKEVELVLQAQGGDKTAFSNLIEPYHATLLAFMRSEVRGREDADDLAQQTVLAALQNIKTLAQPVCFRSWFWSIAKNKVRDWFKNPVRREISLSELERFDDAGQAFEGYLFHTEDRLGPKMELWEEVDSLPSHLREVVRLRYGAGLSHQEIAEIVEPEVCSATVNKRLVEARKLLRQRWRVGEEP
jgi:RNA polymerase sigma-70 factor, ECF subfamily